MIWTVTQVHPIYSRVFPTLTKSLGRVGLIIRAGERAGGKKEGKGRAAWNPLNYCVELAAGGM